MKKRISLLQLASIIILSIFLYGCNTYKWQRKRYYKSSQTKNWNNYNPDKSKKDEDAVLKKYYKQ